VVLALSLAAAAGLTLWPSGSFTLRRLLAGVAAGVAAIALGACAAQARAALVSTKAYMGGAEPVRVEGWVAKVDASDSGPRLRLLIHSIEGLAAAAAVCARCGSRGGPADPGPRSALPRGLGFASRSLRAGRL
jgi:hypothetical protein